MSWNSSTMIARKRHASACAHVLVVAQQVARAELEVLEVERRLALLRRGVVARRTRRAAPAAGPGRGRPARRARPARRPGAPPRSVAARSPCARRSERSSSSSAFPRRSSSRSARVAAPFCASVASVSSARHSRRVAQLLQQLCERPALLELEPQLAPGRAQRLVDAGEHPPQAARAVGREERAVRSGSRPAQSSSSAVSNASPCEHARLVVVEHAEARVEPGRERVRPQQAVAEAVDGRDPGAVELAGEVGPPELDEPRADPRPQLAGGLLGVGDHEDRVDVEAALADGAREALHEHGRLAGAGAGGDEDDAVGLDALPAARRSRAPHPAHRRQVAPVGARAAARIVADVALADALDRRDGALPGQVDLAPRTSSSSR